jgi:DNA-binding transcriptional ArsR family regulator
LNVFVNDELSPVLGAIAHPSRRAILSRLAAGPARVTEIAAPFDLSLNAVSKHLKVLEEAGLIAREKVGRDHILSFRAAPLRQVSLWVHEYERFWNERLDEFEGFFKEKRRRS